MGGREGLPVASERAGVPLCARRCRMRRHGPSGGVRERAAYFARVGGGQAARSEAALVEFDAEERRRATQANAERERGPPPPPLSPRSRERVREAIARIRATECARTTFGVDARAYARAQRLRDRRAREPANWQPPPPDAKPDDDAVEAFDKSKDYYSTLGLDRACSAKEVTRAYRRLALLYHPDKQAKKSNAERAEAERIYERLCEAFDVLVDEPTRRAYDDFLDGQSGRAHGATPRAPPAREYGGRVRAQPTEVEFSVSLFHCYHGVVEPVRHTRRIFDAKGGFVEQTKTYSIVVTAGTLSGARFVFPNAGDESPTTLPGDLVFVLKVRREPSDYLFVDTRGHYSPRDILYDAGKVKRGDVLFGECVWHLDGVHRPVLAELLPAAAAGLRTLEVAVHGAGMPDRTSAKPAPGDLIVRINISELVPGPNQIRPRLVSCLAPLNAVVASSGGGALAGKAVGAALRARSLQTRAHMRGVVLFCDRYGGGECVPDSPALAPCEDALAALCAAAAAGVADGACEWHTRAWPILDEELLEIEGVDALLLVSRGEEVNAACMSEGGLSPALLHGLYWRGCVLGGVGEAACALLSRGARGPCALPYHASCDRSEVERGCACTGADGYVLPPGSALVVQPDGRAVPIEEDAFAAVPEVVCAKQVRARLAAHAAEAASRVRERVDAAGVLTPTERKAALRLDQLKIKVASLAKRAIELKAKAASPGGSKAYALAAQRVAVETQAAREQAEAQAAIVRGIYEEAVGRVPAR